jgi:ParB family chromosome partitioning protein
MDDIVRPGLPQAPNFNSLMGSSEQPKPLISNADLETPTPNSSDSNLAVTDMPVYQEAAIPEPKIPATPEIVESDRVSYADAQIQEIDITKIVPNPFQPRKIFDPEGLKELSDSIREHGVIQPIVVTETTSGYELVVGERRFRASQLAGITKIPAIIKKQLQDQTKLEVALIENIQRRELNPIEEAQAYDRLIKTFNLTQDQVAKKVGKSRPAITNTLRLLNLPAEIQRAVIEGKISEGHARAILGLPDMERQLQMYKTVLEQGLNVRQVESKVREFVVRRQMDAAAPDPKLMALESELRGKLGTQVKILRQGRGGRITIDFFSDEELDDIVHKMAEEKPQNSDDSYFVV